MSRTTAAAVIGGAVLALTMTTAPAASAQPEGRVGQIQNLHFGRCLAANPDQTVGLGPCIPVPPFLWDVPSEGTGQVRSLAANACLTDVDTSNPWGHAVLLQCTGDLRQVWEFTGPDGPFIKNVLTGRYLKANDSEGVYVGSQTGSHPEWAVR
ncbi:RICIN domain-containing protein [Kitasatospora sp. MY 5-36]|uniref:RICIN domain-containing protein n=1 Tax=Kitasatospora sp. MY 5-36 TaxID=1678027 RepID=UPI00131AF23B|nr:RICIN domain-containing protein [Kitasatospora sp. MY 5-36]